MTSSRVTFTFYSESEREREREHGPGKVKPKSKENFQNRKSFKEKVKLSCHEVIEGGKRGITPLILKWALDGGKWSTSRAV